jgi:hypothetical protein
VIVYDFNSWLLDDPELRRLLNYNAPDDSPILPLQDQPEIEGEYILYDFERRRNSQMWMSDDVSINYECWSPSYDRAVEIEEHISRKLRSDQSWQRFQRFARTLPGHEPYSVQELKYTFAGDLEPPSQEGGFFGRIVVVDICYTPHDMLYP